MASDNPKYDAVMNLLGLHSSSELKILKDYIRQVEQTLCDLENALDDVDHNVRSLMVDVDSIKVDSNG